MSLFFDIGACHGDASWAALQQGYTKIVGVEAAPKMFKQYSNNYRDYTHVVQPLNLAASDQDGKTISFYECVEPGLSTTNIDWLTEDISPYKGKQYEEVTATTVTIDTLAKIYGNPDLVKIDVEGAEPQVIKGIVRSRPKLLTFEWVDVYLNQAEDALDYLKTLGYTQLSPQFITHHLQVPGSWWSIEMRPQWIIDELKDAWTSGGWREANLRPTADAGMIWVR